MTAKKTKKLIASIQEMYFALEGATALNEALQAENKRLRQDIEELKMSRLC